jgi:hypothetical protein
MKKTLLAGLFLLSIAFTARAQAIENFHEKFRNDSKYVCVSVESGLLKLLSNIQTDDKDSDEFLRALAGINKINVYKIDRNESSFDEKSFRNFKRDIEKDKYEELMVVRDGSTHLDFMIREDKGKISDLIMMVDEPDEFFLLSLSGNIDLAMVSKISESLDIDGAEHLKKIDEKD